MEKRTKSQRSGQENEDAEGLDHNTAMVSVLDDEPSDIARDKFKVVQQLHNGFARPTKYEYMDSVERQIHV